MSEPRENKHIWEDILGKTGVPPLADSWKAMERRLDKDAPAGSRKKGWRWLLPLFLLLLIGVCNYHRIVDLPRERTANRPTVAAGSGENAAAGLDAGSGGSAGAGSDSGSGASAGSGSDAGSGASTAAGSGVTAGTSSGTGSGAGARTGSGSGTRSDRGPRLASGATWDRGEAGMPAAAEEAAAAQQAARDTATSKIQDRATSKTQDRATSKTQDTATRKTGDTATSKTQDTATRKSPKKKTPPAGPYKGFAAAIGFNQFFPLGAQENAHFNSSGTNGTITDYLPVPEGRYYFSRKFYVQAEVQFNTPQYTSKDLLASQQVILDTTYGGFGLKTSNSVYIKKLYYFNLPLSAHYSPLKNLYLGAGLEYARLTNGVALFQQRNAAYNGANVSTRDSVTYSKVQPFKGDSVYRRLRTNEWRLFLDANYQWKGFTLGLRYNRALDKFINVQVSSTEVTQSRNSSLQLYLRYTIWRQRSLKK